jgi:CheY-like chemotaxis protein
MSGDGSTPRARESARERRGGLCIVLADDNDDLLQMTAWTLEWAGCTVHTATHGARALELADLHRPDVVILDLGMPKLDGYETARAIRARPWGAGVRLIAHSGYGQADDKRRALDAGFDLHLTKPIDPDSLIRAVTNADSAEEN